MKLQASAPEHHVNLEYGWQNIDIWSQSSDHKTCHGWVSSVSRIQFNRQQVDVIFKWNMTAMVFLVVKICG